MKNRGSEIVMPILVVFAAIGLVAGVICYFLSPNFGLAAAITVWVVTVAACLILYLLYRTLKNQEQMSDELRMLQTQLRDSADGKPVQPAAGSAMVAMQLKRRASKSYYSSHQTEAVKMQQEVAAVPAAVEAAEPDTYHMGKRDGRIFECPACGKCLSTARDTCYACHTKFTYED